MKPTDIGIIGGGLAGLTLSILLGKAGFNVACIDAEPLAKQMSGEFDGRTTAISFGSRQVLGRAGVWEALTNCSEAIKTIDILDGDSKATLNFNAREIDAEAFGWIVDNADLRRALIKQVQQTPKVQHMTGVSVSGVTLNDENVTIKLDNSQTLEASLVIGADGRKSFLRDVMNIGAYGRDYKQSALVCLVAHEKPHHGMAVEHFRPEGPFALLPFTDLPASGGVGKQPRPNNVIHRSALVWTVPTQEAKNWKACDEDIFNAALLERSQGRYGRIWAAGRRESWPLTLVKSYSYIAPRAALVAEAAHGIHPIAGQGLNMSLRDLAALTDVLKEAKADGRDIGDIETLKIFQRHRRLDNLAMAFATDGLTMLFSNDFFPVSIARRAGLRLVGRMPAMKKFFMRQAMGLTAFNTNEKSAAKRRLFQ